MHDFEQHELADTMHRIYSALKTAAHEGMAASDLFGYVDGNSAAYIVGLLQLKRAGLVNSGWYGCESRYFVCEKFYNRIHEI